jgi:hypothetical protein
MSAARDFFAWRRDRAGIPDSRRLLYDISLAPGEALRLPLELEGIGTVERERAPFGERVCVWLDVPPPRPMRPALDGEAP